MLLKDYIIDAKRTKATEIYNANLQSVDDAMTLMDSIATEAQEFNAIIYKFNTVLYNIKVCLSIIASYKENLRKLNEFKESHVAHLISEFIATKDESIMKQIEDIVQSKKNDFGVQIIPEWKPGSGERMYGYPTCAFFDVRHIDRGYTFDCYDIEEDIERETERKNAWEDNIHIYIDNKNKMYDLYGFDNLMPLFDRFIHKHGGLSPDPNWANEYLINEDE